MLKKIRIILSLIIFTLISLYFLDFAGWMPDWFHHLAEIQFVPALLALNVVVLISLILLTIVFGRIYCSAICPLGIYQDIVSRISRLTKKKKRFKYLKPLTFLRWSVVGCVLIAFVFGFTFLLGLLDPYSTFGRMTTHVFRPVYMAGNNLLATIFTSFGNHNFYKVSIYVASVSSLIIALITMLIVGYLAWTNGRIYCNTICPVGTILGFFSRFSVFKIHIDENKCNSCGACGRSCKASCIDTKNHKIDYSRCVDCFDCLDVCSQNALNFDFRPVASKDKNIDASKRRFMTAVGVTGLAASQVFADGKLLNIVKNEAKRKTPIAPPGAQSAEHLLSKCTSCHLCVSKCPSNVIKPAFMEYGIGGIMQPTLIFEHGFCNYDCTVCSDVCPSDALKPLTVEQKHHNQMGQVRFTLENCIVHTDGTSCGACSEHCPTQAVHMVPYKDGLTIPHTDVSICVGCGGCEYVCPAKPYKAIYVEGVDKHVRVEIKKEQKQEIEVDDFGF
ncbi:MAG: 4Fe-4S dicluster domain-containing protein [Paludibacter sp.]|nr:4Fe-4S dicluster domain-containing protein [Paludibacter sp.]